MVDLNGLTPLLDTQGNENGVYTVTGSSGDAVQLDFHMREGTQALFNEYGVIRADDTEGRIDGIAPGEKGYAEAALESEERFTLFRSFQGPESHLDDIPFEVGDSLVFYLAADTTVNTALEQPSKVDNIFFSSTHGQGDRSLALHSETLEDGTLQLNWDDSASGDGFEDLVVQVWGDDLDQGHSAPNWVAGGGPAVQIPGEKEDQVVLSFSLEGRSANYKNEMGIFLVDDEFGSIGSLRPGDKGYAQAAIARSYQLFSRRDQAGKTVNVRIAGESYFGSYLIQNASSRTWLRHNSTNQKGKNPAAFFSFMGANPDGKDHISRIGSRFFMEDLNNLGDRSFHDMVVRFDVVGIDTSARPIQHSLINDTGRSNTDRITADAGVKGRIKGNNDGPLRVKAKFIGGERRGFKNISKWVNPKGRFKLSETRLNQIFGSELPDGNHTLVFKSRDQDGRHKSKFEFTLDRNIPLAADWEAPDWFTPTLTDPDASYLFGQTEPGALVTLQETGQQTVADLNGFFAFEDVPLVTGSNQFTLDGEDAAGNRVQIQSTWVHGSEPGDSPVDQPSGNGQPDPDDGLVDQPSGNGQPDPDDGLVDQPSGNGQPGPDDDIIEQSPEPDQPNPTPINEAPTALQLIPIAPAIADPSDAIATPENGARGTVLGTLQTIDANNGDTHTYALVDGSGSIDNLQFLIEGDRLILMTSPNYEAKDQYSIRVRTTDGGNLSYEQALTVTITDVPEIPTTLNIDSTNVMENAPEGTVVGTLSVDDPDATSEHRYTLVNDADGRFQLVDDQIQVAPGAILDYESRPNHAIVVQVEDLDVPGVYLQRTFTLNLGNDNEAPTDLQLTPATSPENVEPGSVIGTLSTTDIDVEDAHTYELVGDASTYPDNAAFTIDGNQLLINYSPDFETRPSYTIRVRTTDAAGISFDKDITITITDANDAPTALHLDPSAIAENNVPDTIIGTFTSTDEDAVDSHTYTLIDTDTYPDNAAFSLTGNQLRITESADFETKPVYTIKVRTIDAGGLSHDQEFTITVTDGNDRPTFTSTPVLGGSEDTPYSYIITVSDPDVNDSLALEAIALPHWLTFTQKLDGTATLTGTPDQTHLGLHSVKLRVTDSHGVTATQTFNILVNNTNDAPTGLALTPTTQPESLAAGSVFGTFATTDADAGDAHTYFLVDNDTYPDNMAFSISGNQLIISDAPDFETKSTYTLKVRTTDIAGDSFDKVITLSITDVNEAPTALMLDSSSVAENKAIGSVIGTFTSTDPDAGDSHIYTLVDTANYADNAAFKVINNELQLNMVPDFEAKVSYQIKVRTIDAGGLSRDQVFTISITNENEAPTFTSSPVLGGSESTPYSYTVTVSDPDLADTLTITAPTLPGWLTFTDNEDSTATLTGNPTQTELGVHHVELVVTDADGLNATQPFTITVNNSNDAPSELALTPTTSPENVAAGSVIGTLSTTDMDSGDTHTYTLVDDATYPDNGAFTIDGNQLRISATPDFETQDSYTIQVRTTDAAGEFFDKVITVTITNVNEAPTVLTLDNSALDENNPPNATIGTFTTTDEDSGDTHTYSLVDAIAYPDNSAFIIVGNALKITNPSDFETQSSYTIKVQTNDAGGWSTDQVFTITINDVNEAPTALHLSNLNLDENEPAGTVVGSFSSTDEDAGDSHSYTLVAGTGDTDNSAFTIDGSNLKLNNSGNFEAQSSYSIRVQTKDAAGLTAEQVFTVTINDVNEAPSFTSTPVLTVDEDSPYIYNITVTDPDIGEVPLVGAIKTPDWLSFINNGDGTATLMGLPEYPQVGTHDILLAVVDAGGLSEMQSFTIEVLNTNDAPTNLTVTPTSQPENIAADSIIGLLSTNDLDTEDTHTYTLEDTANYPDNAAFTVVDNELRINTIPNFEVRSVYTIKLRTTDSSGEHFDKVVSITITDVNETPTALNLSSTAIDENKPAGSVVGAFVTTDEDLGDTHIYTLEIGNGDIDNAAFEIVGNQLKIKDSPNFEIKDTYSIRVRTTDAGGLFYDQVFTIAINNLNEDPSFTSTPTPFATESVAYQYDITVTDPDIADPLTVTAPILPNWLTFTDNGDGTATLTGTPTVSHLGSHAVQLIVKDAAGASENQIFTILVQEPPIALTDIKLVPASVFENVPANTVIGQLSTVDENLIDSHSYTLIAGDGDTDNGNFAIIDDVLHITTVPDYESQDTYSIRVQTTDITGLTFEKTFEITVNDINEPPTLITLTPATIEENSEDLTLVGTLSSVNPDAGDENTYVMVDDAEGRFALVGGTNRVIVKDGTLLDFEANTSHTIRVRSTDTGAPPQSIEQDIVITITNVNEAPYFTSTPEGNAETGVEYTYAITAEDPDLIDTLKFSASDVPDWLTLVDNGDGTASLSGTPDTADMGLYNILLVVEDAEGLQAIQNVLVAVNLVLEENSDFSPEQAVDLIIPATPSVLTFKLDQMLFDITDTDSINDAFEVVLLDEEGLPLVQTAMPDTDAFLNWTEAKGLVTAPGTSYDVATQTVTLNLTGLKADTPAQLLFRLVNNDTDIETEVHITDLQIKNAPDGMTPPLQPVNLTSQLQPIYTPIDFATLGDVSPSIQPNYGRTTFNEDTKRLQAEITLENTGTYSIDAPLLVVVRNISDPSVQLRKPDGYTPESLPYYDFSHLVEDGKFNPGDTLEGGVLDFHNPNQVQFTYDLVVLSSLNQAPTITSDPIPPGVDLAQVVMGNTYRYDVETTDPDNDTLTYTLLVAPDGMAIDSATGEITWQTSDDPATDPDTDIGNHSIVVEVTDGFGGSDLQGFTLTVLDIQPNRPPIFTTDPVVDAYINQPYEYDADAVDPDEDNPLSYSLILGPEGMTVNSGTGEVNWTAPPAILLGDTVLGTFRMPGTQDEFFFSGSEGQTIYFDPLRYSGDYRNWDFEVYSPSGEKIIDQYLSAETLITLNETGNYRIVLDPVGDQIGSYGFSVINTAMTPSVLFDTPIDGSLSPGSESDVYRFSGNEGQKLFIDRTQLSNSANWILYGPRDQVVFSEYMHGYKELYLPEDGDYHLVIQGTRGFTETVNYSFEIITPDEITLPMNLGTNDSPNAIITDISEKGEEDFFTFTGTSGQRIHLDRLAGSSAHTLYIYDPTGSQILSHWMDYHDPDPILLDRDGTYKVRVDTSAESTGAYGFSLLDVDDATPIALDTPITNKIDPSRETHIYKFNGNADQRLFLDTLGGSYTADWRLFNSGRLVASSNFNNSWNDDLEVVLDKDDTYTLLIKGNNGTAFDYNFEVITPDVHTASLPLNTSISGTISEKGEQDIYTFTGAEGQRLFLDTLETNSNIRFTLSTPSGSTYALNDLAMQDDASRHPFRLLEDGDYQLMIDGVRETTGTYSFQLLDIDTPNTLGMETVASGNLDARAIEFYQFTGTAGQRIYLDSQGSSPNTAWHLYQGGHEMREVALSSDFEVVLPVDGTYHLMLRSEHGSAQSYAIQLVPTVAEPAPLTYTVDTVATGEITKLGEQDIFTFSATEGQRLYFDPQTGSSTIIVNINGPDGTVFDGSMGADADSIYIPRTGNYTITVDGAQDATGAYSFQLMNWADQTPLTLGTLSNTLSAGETQLYLLNGNQGDQYQFESITAAGGTWTLYAPGQQTSGNTAVASSALTGDFTAALATDGAYLLAVQNNTASDLSYEVQVSDITSSVTNNGFNTVYSGTTSTAGDDTFTITANAGTLVFLDGQFDSRYQRVKLTAPDGSNIFTNVETHNDSGPYLVPQTGNYSLEAYPYWYSGDYKFQLLDLASAADDLTLNDVTNVTLSNKETKVLKFTGTEGQKVWFDGLNTGNPSVTARLYTPAGHKLWEQADLTSDVGLQTLTEDGDYYLVLSSQTFSNTTASFRLLDDAGATDINLDTEVTGNFGSTKREAVLYSFTGAAGDRLFFDRTVGDYDNYWRLHDPSGQSLTGNTRLDSDMEVVLSSDGEYLLSTYSYGDSNSSYAFTIVTPDSTTVAYTVGNTVNGEITEKGEQDTYTFDATSGQSIYFDGLGNGTNLTWSLYSPSGATLFEGKGDEVDQWLSVKESGEYTLVLDGSGEATGEYSFRLFDWDVEAAANSTTNSIDLDTIIAGDFGSSQWETDAFTFTGIAGQVIYGDRTIGDGENGWYQTPDYWGIYDPAGNQIQWQTLGSDFEIELPATGTYTLRLRGDGDANNNYEVQLITPDHITTAYTIVDGVGEVVSSEITEKGEQDSYTFTATAGQSIYFDSLGDGPGLNWILYSPSGQEVFNAADQSDQWPRMKESGEYTLVIDGSGESTGAYSFRLFDWDIVGAANEINLDEDTTVDFGTTKRETEVFTFSATEGEYLYLNRTAGGSYYDSWGLYDENDSLISTWQRSYTDIEFGRLPYTGDYSLRFSSYGYSSSQTFNLVTPDLITTEYTLGDTISGTISEAGEKDYYTFEGSDGQSIFFDSLGDGGSLNWRLYSPSGVQLFSEADQTDKWLTLEEDGTYTLEFDADWDHTPSYSFRVFDWHETANANSLTLDFGTNATISSDFGSSWRETDVYGFRGTQGDSLYFDRSAGHTYDRWGLYDPNGNQLKWHELDDDFELILPESGDYTLRLSGYGHSSSYAFRIGRSEPETMSLAVGETTTSELTYMGEQDTYTFTGNAGQLLYFDSIYGQSDVKTYLYSPSGRLVSSNSTGADWAAPVLTEDGTYQLVVDGEGTISGISYSFVLGDRSITNSLPIDTPISNSLNPGSEAHLYSFTGTQGQVFNFDLDAETWGNNQRNWVLYDNYGKAVATPSWNSPDFSHTIATDGLYTLSVGGSMTAIPHNYRFTVTEVIPETIANTGFDILQSGTLAAGATADYTFTAQAGTQILFDGQTWGAYLWSRLIAPDGSYVFNNHDSQWDSGIITLPQSGTYTVQMYGQYGWATGDYAYQIIELPDTEAEATNGLQLGTVHTDSLYARESKVYSFQGRNDQQLLFNGIAGTYVNAYLYKANGDLIFSRGDFRTNDNDGLILDQDEMYYLVIANTNSARDASFQMLDMKWSSEISMLVDVSGRLDANGKEYDLYRFDAEANDHIYFNQLSGGNTASYWRLYDPHMQLVPDAGTYLDRDFEVTVPETGTYTLAVYGWHSSPIDYKFQVIPEQHPLELQQLITPGTGETADSDADSQNQIRVQIGVEDARGATSIQDYDIKLLPDPSNAAPVITSTPSHTQVGLNQKGYVYQITSLDPDGDTVQYRLLDGPSGSFVDNSTGELIWMPEGVSAGTIGQFTIEANDGRGGIDTQSLDVDVVTALGQIKGAIFEDINSNGYRDTTLVRGDSPDIVFAIDISGSAGGRTVDFTTIDLEAPGNGISSILEMELATALALSEQLIFQGRGDTAKIGLVLWNTGARVVDMDPSQDGIQIYTTALADTNDNGIPDLREILNINSPGGGTDFTPGLSTAKGVLDSLPGDPNLIFMSDGFGGLDEAVVEEIRDAGINLTAFGIGAGAGMAQLRKVDPNALQITDVEELVSIFSGWDSRYSLEPFVDNITVYLDLNNNGSLDENEPWQLTEKGIGGNVLTGESPYYFNFENLEPGTYTLRQVVPNGYTQTAPVDPVVFTGEITDEGEALRYMFGLHKETEPPNQNPYFLTTAPDNPTLETGEDLLYRAEVQDPDADPVTLALTLAPDGMALDAETGDIVWIPTADQAGTHSVILRATDGEGGFALQSFNVTVLPPNTLPTISSSANPSTRPQVAKPFQYQVQAQDENGDDLTFSLVGAPSGLAIDSDTGVLTWTPTAAQEGEHTFTIQVADDRGGTLEQPMTLTVIPEQPNTAPTISSEPRTQVRLGNSYFYQVAAEDADGDTLTYALTTAPAGMAIDSEGLVTWQPDADQSGEHSITLTVDDGNGHTTTQTWEMLVAHQAPNAAPVVTSVPETVTNLTRFYQYQATATDADGDHVLWSLPQGPDGMVIDPNTGVISWQPTIEQIGDHEIEVQVRDTLGLASGQLFTLRVTSINAPPRIISNAITQVAKDQAYRYQVVATDPENDDLIFRLGVQPEGMAIDADTGLITWMPTASQVGDHTVEVKVQDDQGEEQVQRYTLKVVSNTVNHAPIVTSTPIYVATAGQAYDYTVAATDEDGDAIAYELLDAPAGVTLDGATGQLTWSNPTVGQYKIVVGASDGRTGAAQGYQVTVRPDHPPVLSSTNPPTIAIPNDVYRYDVNATDPNGDPLTYTLDNASIALGMTLDKEGRLRWTPTDADAGTHDVTITIADATGSRINQTFTLTVSADTQAPVVNIRPFGNLYTLGSDPQLYTDLGNALTLQAVASDNVGIDNLQLRINGTPTILNAYYSTKFEPTTDGMVTLEATATDAAGNSTTTTLDIMVVDPTALNAPEVKLDLSNLEDGLITNLSDIKGMVTDADDNLKSYTLEVAPLNTDNWITMFEGSSEVAWSNTLGTFDPTFIDDGSYRIRLSATDFTGFNNYVEDVVDVSSGQLKFGEFQVSFTDMVVESGNLQIPVTRTYDSLTTDEQGDFGPGWRLEFRNVRLSDSLPDDEMYEEYGIRSVGFKDNTRVFITLPGGVRQTFEFEPEPHPELKSLGFGRIMVPAFKAVGNTTSSLYVLNGNSNSNIFTTAANDWYVNGAGVPYNPSDPYFASTYLLINDDTAYSIDPVTGNIEQLEPGAEYGYTTSALQTGTGVGDVAAVRRFTKIKDGDPITVTDGGMFDADGNALVTFERDAQGRIVSVTDKDDNQVKYQYSAAGDLVKVTDVDETDTRFKYKAVDSDWTRPHYLNEIIDPLNRSVIRNEYDEQGRLSIIKDALGNPINFSYDPDQQLETITDPLGNATTYVYDERGNTVQQVNPDGGVQQFTYDIDNNLLSATDPLGHTTSFTYDNKGQPLTETDPLGNTTTYSYNSRGDITTIVDAMGYTTTLSYNSLGELESVTDAEGTTSTFKTNAAGQPTLLQLGNTTIGEFTWNGQILEQVVDQYGNITTYDYDAQGRPIKETVTAVDGEVYVTTRTFDDNDRVVSETSPSGITTVYEYDEAGQLTAIEHDGERVEYLYDATGNLTTVFYADGSRETFEYDALGQLVAETSTDGITTQYTYDSMGRLVETVFPDDTPADDSDNLRIEMTYDQAGNLTSETDFLGNTWAYSYDAAGNKTQVTDSAGGTTTYGYDAKNRRNEVIDALGRVVRYEYNSRGLPIKTILPDGSFTSINVTDPTSVTDNTIEVTDALGNTRAYTMVNNQGIASVISATGTTEYIRDSLGRLTEIKDANGNSLTYEYNAEGQLIKTTLPSGESRILSYYGDGRLSTVTTPDGDITYTYDAQNRIASITDDSGTTTYTYTDSNQTASTTDDNGTVSFVYDADGQLTTRSDSEGFTNYIYDDSGRLLTRSQSDGRFITYTYNSIGQIDSISSNAGTTNYAYNTSGLLNQVTDVDGRITNYTYNAVGQVTRVEYANGLVEQLSYNDLGHLIGIDTAQGGTIISGFDYTRDSVGNILRMEEHSGRVVEYDYDNQYRLTQETIKEDGTNVDRTISYTYDAVGNRLSRDDSVEGLTVYTYDAANRLVSSDLDGISTDYTYDAQGRLTRKETDTDHWTSYEWNRLDQLTQIEIQDGVESHLITYRYDDDGNRIAQVVDGVETRYLVDSNRFLSQIREEYDSDGTLKANYTYDLNQLPISQTRAGETFYYHGDNLGNTRSLTDQTGIITDQYTYDAYGRILNQVGSTENPHRYTGEPTDSLTGLTYLRARYLDNDTGRFISRDPYNGSFNDPTSQHKYQYAHLNPVINRDPTGKWTMIEAQTVQKIQSILDKADRTTKVFQLQQLEQQVNTLVTVLFIGKVGFEIVSYLSGQNLTMPRMPAFSVSTGGSGLSDYQVWEKPKTAGPATDRYNRAGGKGLKKMEFGYSIDPDYTNLLGGTKLSAFIAVEKDNANGSLSGDKAKVTFETNPLEIKGSLSQEFTLAQDDLTGGKGYKLVVGAAAEASAAWGGEAKFGGFLYSQLALAGGVVKFKYTPIGFGLRQGDRLQDMLYVSLLGGTIGTTEEDTSTKIAEVFNKVFPSR